MADELFEVRNLFYLGNYQGSINKANKLNPSNASVKLDRDIYVYRASIALRNTQIVLDETESLAATSVPHAAARALALYQTSPQEALAIIQPWLADTATLVSHQAVQLIAAIILYGEGRLDDAMRALHHQPSSLEGMALMVQLYLAVNRPELAENQLRAMQQIDDDSPLTQLAAAWSLLNAGGDKVQEAQLTFQELSDKYGSTPLLLSGLAACAMRGMRWADGERLLLEAQEKGARDAETMANLVVCSMHMAPGSSTSQRYLSQLRSSFPNHPFLARASAFDAALDAAASRVAV
eukprot:m51a1_g8676 putative coatomer epsilon subunit isoform 1 (294) ;mRNA; f:151840-153318